MATVPLLIVFFLAQRQFIEGVAMSGFERISGKEEETDMKRAMKCRMWR